MSNGFDYKISAHIPYVHVIVYGKCKINIQGEAKLKLDYSYFILNTLNIKRYIYLNKWLIENICNYGSETSKLINDYILYTMHSWRKRILIKIV